MLRLENIKKDYKVADTTVHALKGVSLSFRKNEFVSILGPSGCGKTTLLNIIGGLDQYSSGDLFIAGRSTKEFKDKDWDVYRNHRIGFIFQSYNLIPHQTILGNVELALTIAGISKEERTARAKKAIDRVGLEGQYNKKPNQLSGGQCQRVAIARALVNEPEILLADEPTGALDTQTSIQIMDLIKEISKEKLVIMVTHNPDLARQYSTRIVRLLDGELVSDSNPYDLEQEVQEDVKIQQTNEENEKSSVYKKKEKAKMSFWTAFKLSLRNLFTKKARTALTCIAGSIGIIGVSSVLAVSSGVTGYITSMQDDMLSGNPVEISETAYDLSAMMNGMNMSEKMETMDILEGKVNVSSVIKRLLAQGEAMEKMQIKNNITQNYIDYVYSMQEGYAAAISLGYGIDVTNNIYTDFQVNYHEPESKQHISLSAIKSIYTSVLKDTEYSQYASYVTSLTNVFQQAPNNKEYIESQYDLLYGDDIALKENEIMIVVNNKQELTDLLFAQLGFYTQDQFINTMYRHLNDDAYDESIDKNRFDFSELIGKKFMYYPNDQVYEKNMNPVTSVYSPYRYKYQMDPTGGTELVVKAILKPKPSISYGCMTSGFFYTEAFAKKFIRDGLTSEVVKYLEDNDLTYFGAYDQTNLKFITYDYTYQDPDGNSKKAIGYVGQTSMMTEMLGTMMGGNGSSTQNTAMYTTLSLRHLGGIEIANSISIYPINFDLKSGVTKHLDAWNSDQTLIFKNQKGQTITLSSKDREKITYTDNIAVVIDMINNLISLITTALISFTALALVVSCFMIAIITYVSVVERVKEIGVIRSLGGRKRDVTHLFNAETFIIGLISGVFGIAVTYLISLILNIIVKNLSGVSPIADLPLWQALVMILVSVSLTVISGLIPSRSAAKKDPVVALRTE